ncbi:general secretion pathway protein GspK [Elongatibacter sediminis]|uniref:T2SS protein K first SAM-like domain-containing protein n=1 Tax=Elongatibacter sediminis TaxID=3119006 RepID=A0AAW9RJ71_9GAMM
MSGRHSNKPLPSVTGVPATVVCSTMSGPGRQRGVALVLVLWILLLVTISTGAYTLMARMDSLEAHTTLWSTRARLAAEAGLNMAVVSLRDPVEEERWIPDGRPYTIQYGEAEVELRITDERGKLNVNHANEETLIQLFVANGLEETDSVALAGAVLDWIDPDMLVRPNGAEEDDYLAAGYQVGPANRGFLMVEEMLQVLGLPWELYQLIEPGLTVWSDGNLPDPAYAPVEALVALPDMTREDASEFVTARHDLDGSSDLRLALPSGQVAVAQGRGLTYSIVAKATMPNGVWDQIEATIRLGGNPFGYPFNILRWREGFHH